MSGLSPQYIEDVALRAKLKPLLQWCEDEMRKGITQIAAALEVLRREERWRADPQYTSFGDYCRKKLKFSEQRACQLILGAGTLKALQDASGEDCEMQETLESLPEISLRQLRKVEPKKAVKVIKKLAKAGKVTVRRLAGALGKSGIKPVIPLVQTCPHCGKSLSKSQSTDNDDDEMP